MRLPDPIANTTTEAYLAYKAGVLAEGDLKPKLYEPYIHLDAWLAYWTGLTTTYPVKNVGKNLFDMDNLEGHYFYNSNTYQPNSENLDWDCSQPIPVESNTTYTISMGLKSGESFSNAQIIYWDADKNGVGSVWGNIRTTLTTGADVKFMTIAYRNKTWENVQLEKGSTATAYEPYTGEPEMLTDEEAYIAYLSGVTDTYPEEFRDPADIRVAAYLRYLISGRWGRPEYPVNNEEFYLSLMKTKFIPSGDPSSDIKIDGTAKAPFVDVKMYGDMSQTTYTGKNMFNLVTPGTSNGVTVTANADGSFTINGTTTGVAVFNFRLPTPKPAGTYTISCTSKNQVMELGSFFIRARKANMSMLVPTVPQSQAQGNGSYYCEGTFTSTENMVYVALNLTISGKTYNNMIIYPQVEVGGTATDWERYVGGVPAPNPDYPQAVNTVTGTQTVTVYGKNLLSLNPNTDNGLTGNIQDDSIVTITGKATNTSARIATATASIPAGTYTFSIDRPSANVTNLIIGTNNGNVSFRIASGQTSTTATLTTSGYDYSLWVGAVRDTTYNDTYKLQLEQGSTATAFTKYNKQTLPISLGSIELCKLGTYQDYIYENEGKWYVRKEVGEITLSGSENWVTWGTGDMYRYYTNSFSSQIAGLPQTASALSDHFRFAGVASGNLDDGKFWFNMSTGTTAANGNITFNTSTIATAADWKTWLTSNNTTVYCPLATATDTAITDTALIAQLEALVKGGSEEGTTYIKVSAQEPNLPGLLYVEAAKYIE